MFYCVCPLGEYVVCSMYASACVHERKENFNIVAHAITWHRFEWMLRKIFFFVFIIIFVLGFLFHELTFFHSFPPSEFYFFSLKSNSFWFVLLFHSYKFGPIFNSLSRHGHAYRNRSCFQRKWYVFMKNFSQWIQRTAENG